MILWWHCRNVEIMTFVGEPPPEVPPQDRIVISVDAYATANHFTQGTHNFSSLKDLINGLGELPTPSLTTFPADEWLTRINDLAQAFRKSPLAGRSD